MRSGPAGKGPTAPSPSTEKRSNSRTALATSTPPAIGESSTGRALRSKTRARPSRRPTPSETRGQRWSPIGRIPSCRDCTPPDGERSTMTARKLRESRFLQDVVTLMSGTVVAQALPMAFSPIMTRLFAPADYGVLGVYTAFTGILSVLVNSQYNHAIMLPAEDEDSINILGLCFAISIGTGAILAGAVVFNNHVYRMVQVPND